MMNEHIHTADDGRGMRDVYVNGNKIDGVTYADTKLGFVIYAPKPFRVEKGKDYVYTRRLEGNVEVVER